MSQKTFYETSWNSRASKYVVRFHDGVQTHKDGSEFFDCRTFSAKPKRDEFVKGLRQQGYVPYTGWRRTELATP